MLDNDFDSQRYNPFTDSRIPSEEEAKELYKLGPNERVVLFSLTETNLGDPFVEALGRLVRTNGSVRIELAVDRSSKKRIPNCIVVISGPNPPDEEVGYRSRRGRE